MVEEEEEFDVDVVVVVVENAAADEAEADAIVTAFVRLGATATGLVLAAVGTRDAMCRAPATMGLVAAVFDWLQRGRKN